MKIDPQIELEKLLLLKTESETVEFKEAKSNFNFSTLGEYFSALSNEANLLSKDGAWLIFGINDKRKVVGTSYRNDEASLNSLKREIAEQTTGGVSFKEIYTLMKGGKRVVMFHIPAASKGIPIAWKGHYYGRNHESLCPLNIEELERIRNQSINEDWSAGICESASIEDLDKAAIRLARENYKSKNPNLSSEVDLWDDVTFLNKTKVCINGKPTRTAIILLGKQESEHYISPAIAKISWILKDKDGREKDYAHFSCPFILSVKEVYAKVRNLKYRYLPEGSLFPEEVDQYDPYIIREALNNSIAHQDYSAGGKINVVEFEDDSLCFSNAGSFIPKTIENVIKRETPDELYRNRFLATAMVQFNMIDAIGSGIKRMFRIQRGRFFPLPDYDFSGNKVRVEIVGKVVDLNYARILAKMPGLDLDEIILLDKVQKKKVLTEKEKKHLRKRGLIEGRYPNYYISSDVAKSTGQESDYMKQRGIDDSFCKKIIVEYLQKFKIGKRSDFENILLDKLPDSLTIVQKKAKIKNNLQALRRNGVILVLGRGGWELVKGENLDEI